MRLAPVTTDPQASLGASQRHAEVRSFAPNSRRKRERTPFARGEALALATVMRFRDAPAGAVSACELDAALSQLSTERLQAFLTLDWRTQPARFEPPPSPRGL